MPHPQRAALVGLTLQDKYRIDRVVGEGGMGVVYAALHLTLDVPVAVKALLFQSDHTAEQRAALLARFSAEAQILARLRHPNIVSVLDFGIASEAVSDPIPWLVLEWCDGETLDAELRRRRKSSPRAPPRSIEEAWALMRPIIDAIAYGHAHGVAHRDLKPANVMLVPSRTGVSPRVLDFGIAKRVEEGTSGSGETLTTSGAAVFTPGYAAPEQVAMVRTGPWTDVHALGLIFTELLTDQRPYPTANGMVAAVDPERPTPARFGRDVGALEPLLAKAVALRPGERFADAEQFLDALDALLGTSRLQVPRPIPAPAPLASVTSQPLDETYRTGPKTLQASTSESVPLRARSGRWWLAVGTAVVLAIALSAAVLTLAMRPAGSASDQAAAPEPAAAPVAPSLAARAPAPAPSSIASAMPPAASVAASAKPAPSKRAQTVKSVKAKPAATPPASTGRPAPALY